jgi:hypothetical protein
MYRIENVIYVRIKAVAEQRSTTQATARLLCYRPRPRLPLRTDGDAVALESVDPHEPL